LEWEVVIRGDVHSLQMQGVSQVQLMYILSHSMAGENVAFDHYGSAFLVIPKTFLDVYGLWRCLWWLWEDVVENPVILSSKLQNAIASALDQPEPELDDKEE
jgi:hypothetical protein